VRPPFDDFRDAAADFRPPFAALRPAAAALRPPFAVLRPPFAAFRLPFAAFRPPVAAFRPPVADVREAPFFVLRDAVRLAVAFLREPPEAVVPPALSPVFPPAISLGAVSVPPPLSGIRTSSFG
jgi:hypothetical protein